MIEQSVPTLILRLDGYQILWVTGVFGVAWILVCRQGEGIQQVASGRNFGFNRAHRNAYNAMKIHKADVASRDKPT